MGILNITPDSFYDGGKHKNQKHKNIGANIFYFFLVKIVLYFHNDGPGATFLTVSLPSVFCPKSDKNIFSSRKLCVRALDWIPLDTLPPARAPEISKKYVFRVCFWAGNRDLRISKIYLSTRTPIAQERVNLFRPLQR